MPTNEYQMDPEEWTRLETLSAEVVNTPVIALSSAAMLDGRDFASLARQAVLDYWVELGHKYGFDGSTVEPVDPARRLVRALSVPLAEPTFRATEAK